MLRVTVRLAAFYCSTKKRRVQSATQAHTRVSNVHTQVSLREGTVRTRGYTDVRSRAARRSPAGDIYLSSDLYCSQHRMIYTAEYNQIMYSDIILSCSSCIETMKILCGQLNAWYTELSTENLLFL